MSVLSRFREDYEREDAVAAERLPARRRRMLLLSMIVVIPLGVVAFGTGLNVALAAGSVASYEAGDYEGSASWARASVSLNPFDGYTPHYNLGTAYAADDLLPEAVPELQTALDRAPNPEAACFPRANLALTLERLGDRFSAAEDFDGAMDSYRQALALWQEQPDDVCYDDDAFREKAENSIPRLEAKLAEAQQDSQEQSENGTGEDQGDGSGTGGDSSGGGQGGTDPSDGSGEGGDQGDGTDPGDGSGGGGSGDGTDPGGGGDQGDGQGGSGGSGDQGGSGGEAGGEQQGGSGGAGGSGGSQEGDSGDGGGGGEVTSGTLGDKLDEIRELGELSDRERQNSGHKQGLSDKPW